MKIKELFLIAMILFMINSVNAHGVDVTEDVMVLSDESTGILAKKLAEEMNFEVKVYKFTSNGDVEHQLEHALTNKNKKILVVAYQDIANEFIQKNEDLSKRIIVVNSDEESILDGLNKLKQINNINDSNTNSSENNSVNNMGNMHLDFTSLILILVIIGLISVMGIVLIKRKK